MTDDTSIEEIRERKIAELREERGTDGADGSDGDEGTETAAGPTEPVHVHGAPDLRDLVESEAVVLVDFHADWCGPCQMLEPIVEDVAAETGAAVAKVDVDANQALAGEYGVRGIPTLVVFADGEPVDRMVGMQQKDSLVAAVERHL